LSLRWVALTLGCVLLLAIGQMLFKVAAGGWRVEGWSLATLRNFLSAPMLAALVVYAIATFAWVFVLRHVPLGAAYRDRGRARARRAARRAPATTHRGAGRKTCRGWNGPGRFGKRATSFARRGSRDEAGLRRGRISGNVAGMSSLSLAARALAPALLTGGLLLLLRPARR
jgi:hypothetical protein